MTDGIDDVMRKPLVLACVAVATLATGGGVTATALAQAASGVPDAADVRPSGDDPASPAAGRAGFGGVPGVHGGWTGTPSAATVRWSPAATRPTSGGVPGAAAAPGATGDREGERHREGKRDRERGEGHGGPGADRDEQARRPRRAARPGNPGFAAADLIATSREAVTARDISDSPAARVQLQVLALVNRNRREAGCDTVTPDRRLIEAANRHAADMARRGYFDHENPRGQRAGDRVSGVGYAWRRYGENIARGQRSPFEVVEDWMDSPGHRENIVDCRLEEMGVGLAIAGDDTRYWVQDFATPR